MALVFPYLPGLTWPVDRSEGLFDTTTQVSGSGKKTSFANKTQATYRYSLAFEGLDSSGANAGLIAYSKQALSGFFNQTLGGAAIFNFFDVDDGQATAQSFGTGDGATATFQLARSSSGWVDYVFAPMNAAAPTLVPGPAGGQVYAPNNLWVNANSLGSAYLGNVTVAAGATDPAGGTLAVTMSETAATGIHFLLAGANSRPAGVPVTYSVYVKQGTSRYAAIGLDNGSPSYAGAGMVVDLQTGTILSSLTFNGAGAALTTRISAAPNGFWRVSLSFIPDATTTYWEAYVFGCASSSPTYGQSYAGNTANNIIVAFPQVEASVAIGGPSVYLPTLSAANFGAPSIFKAGVLQDPSTWSLGSTGAITFASAPAGGAALTWTGPYYWPCQFDDDALAASKFMGGLWEAKKVSFTTRIF